MNLAPRIAARAAPVLAVGAAIGWWQVRTRDSSSLYLKAPSEIAEAMRLQLQDHDLLSGHVWPSLHRMLLGWGVAVLVGVGLGVLLGRRRRLRPWVAPALHLGRAIPPPALVGMLFVSFGPGDSPKVFVVFLAALFPILFNTIDGAESVDPLRLDVAFVSGVGRADHLWRIVLPSAGPKIFAGLRSSSTIALIVAVTAEYTGSVNGLGRVMNEAQTSFRWVDVWVVLVVLAALGIAINAGLVAAERRVLGWHRAEAEERDG